MTHINIHGVPEHMHTGDHGYGFNVQHRRDHTSGELVGYSVKLGHQCDRWVIVDGGRWDKDTRRIVYNTRAVAVAELRQFIAEAGAALTALIDYRPTAGGNE